mgnify:CR=1 FL=1
MGKKLLGVEEEAKMGGRGNLGKKYETEANEEGER